MWSIRWLTCCIGSPRKSTDDDALSKVFVESGRQAAVPSDRFLSEMHIAADSSVVQIYPHLLRIRQAGAQETRPGERACARDMAHTALQPVGRKRV